MRLQCNCNTTAMQLQCNFYVSECKWYIFWDKDPGRTRRRRRRKYWLPEPAGQVRRLKKPVLTTPLKLYNPHNIFNATDVKKEKVHIMDRYKNRNGNWGFQILLLVNSITFCTMEHYSKKQGSQKYASESRNQRYEEGNATRKCQCSSTYLPTTTYMLLLNSSE